MPTHNAHERRLAAKEVFDAYFDTCPSRRLLERISNKWVVLILSALGDGAMRYSELSDKVVGVSQKMLTQTLRALERDGLVTRTLTASVPPRTDYELTALGDSLRVHISVLKKWAEDNMAEIDSARESYDRARSAD